MGAGDCGKAHLPGPRGVPPPAGEGQRDRKNRRRVPRAPLHPLLRSPGGRLSRSSPHRRCTAPCMRTRPGTAPPRPGGRSPAGSGPGTRSSGSSGSGPRPAVPAALRALDKGYHILLEKPISPDLGGAFSGRKWSRDPKLWIFRQRSPASQRRMSISWQLFCRIMGLGGDALRRPADGALRPVRVPLRQRRGGPPDGKHDLCQRGPSGGGPPATTVLGQPVFPCRRPQWGPSK